MAKSRKVFVASLAGRQASLPHSEQGSTPIKFRPETGEAYVWAPKQDSKGVDQRDDRGQLIYEERALTDAEVEAVKVLLHVHGVVIV